MIKPFSIDIPQSTLDELAAKLASTRLPAPLPGDDRNTGVPVSWLSTLVEYWRTSYDWRAAEKELNSYPQFTAEIEGQRIHFIHVRSAEPDALPLMLTHGWPGSIVEFLDLIGPLTDPVAFGGQAADAFHVVIPALPGFGFSGPTADDDWTFPRIGRVWAALMSELGYERYGVQGGDLGGSVSPEVGRAAPSRVVGVHTNGGTNLPPLQMSDEELQTLTPLEQDKMARIARFMQEEFGYISIQSTRPQTLGYGLVDSPVAQLAWIMDKFKAWTYPAETLPEAIISKDRLLTNVMMYWLTGTGGSAAYIGYAQPRDWTPRPNSGVPTAVLAMAHDVAIRRYCETSNTITRWTDADHGGHFAALEAPELLVNDVREFFRDLRE
ncbi:epoxide hydrolase family protein [Kribbella speibonae]|uniref:Epoxide hydrolase n=1 Tax=Kribbella speibonae TaxID=1572660 RepID=A0A4R0JJ27_9ACTN|nr:epoxide hydrolase family protein [Kribbella speibonae]TCC41785.1 epoxide hydrolase [Kribbella speibonae]